jgi:hypothetical protein
MFGLNLPGVTLSLLIGPMIAVPAPSYLAEALESVQVTHNDAGPSGFQLTFNADRSSAFSPDYVILISQLLSVGMRVVLVVTLSNGIPQVLSDGFITNLQMSHSKVFGAASISVTGEDIGVIMDRIQVCEQYPAMGAVEIVGALLAKYAMFGVAPMIIPTPTELASDPLERVPVQNATDRAYINTLAGQHGYVFMIRPGLAPMTNIAYWGPPPRVGPPQTTLSMDMGPATNVNSLDFTFDGLAPTRFFGVDQDSDTEADIPITTVGATRIPLAALPALLSVGPMARLALFSQTGMDAAKALAYAQAMTDKSTDDVVTVNGNVDTVVYGSVMQQPGLIALRGAGMSFDGFYFVKSVTHSIKRGEYTQQFTLTREGLMPLSPVAPP